MEVESATIVTHFKVCRDKRLMQWSAAFGCSNYTHPLTRSWKKNLKIVYLSHSRWQIRKISCGYFALRSIEAAVGGEMGTSEMNFSLPDCDEAQKMSLLFTVKCWCQCLRLVFDVPDGWRFYFPLWHDMSSCDVMLSTAGRNEMLQLSTNTSLGVH